VLKEKGDWKFDSKVVPIFDEHVRQSVPLYEEMHRLLVDISYWFIEDNTNVYDIGTSTGETLVNLSETHKNKIINYVGVDTSPEMVEKARKRLDSNNISISVTDSTDSNFIITNASFVTSVLTAMFIPQRKRQGLINKIYDGLNKGGGFILIEKIVGNNARFDEMWIELYHDLKLRNGLNQEEVMAKSRSIRGILRPYTVNENIHMLQEAGFKDIDMFFKWNNFAGFLAIK
jgi:tRNA (cmo5U34)-methyltransferase